MNRIILNKSHQVKNKSVSLIDIASNIMSKPPIDVDKAHEEMMNFIESKEIDKTPDIDKRSPFDRLGLL
jgi:hypothetical protein